MSALRAPEPSGSEQWLARDAAALASVLPRATDVVAASAHGSWLTDVDGRRYLDLTSGIAVTNLGHSHPRVVDAVVAQAMKLVHTSVVTRLPPAIELAEKLIELVPYIDDAQVFFCNAGAEAVDGSIKMARRVTGRPGVIAFRGAFHGRTLAATSLTTAKPKYREGYEPLLPSVYIAPYAYPLRYGGEGEATREALAELDRMLASTCPPQNIGAMIVEPVLGEGGYVPPPKAWLEGLRERCSKHGMLLVFDEVQTGVARTGAFFAAERYGVAPDVILFAKAIANGLPLGGLIASRSLLDAWPAGAHGSTFGGNPVSCAAASAVIDVVAEDGLCERAAELGARALETLSAASGSQVAEVRGLGLMVAVEFHEAAGAERAQRACLEAGVLVLRCGPDENVLRLIPPLTISDDDLALGLGVLTRTMD